VRDRPRHNNSTYQLATHTHLTASYHNWTNTQSTEEMT